MYSTFLQKLMGVFVLHPVMQEQKYKRSKKSGTLVHSRIRYFFSKTSPVIYKNFLKIIALKFFNGSLKFVMILGQLYYEFMKGLYEINNERAENVQYSIFILLIIFPFSLHMQELQTNFRKETIDNLTHYDQCCSQIKKLSLNMELEYNTELQYSGN